MYEGWKMIVSLSLSGTLLMVLLLLGRPFFRKYLSHTWQYYVWLAVILRLLLPVTAPVNLVGGILQPTGNRWQRNIAAVQEQPVYDSGGVGRLSGAEVSEPGGEKGMLSATENKESLQNATAVTAAGQNDIYFKT